MALISIECNIHATARDQRRKTPFVQLTRKSDYSAKEGFQKTISIDFFMYSNCFETATKYKTLSPYIKKEFPLFTRVKH